MAKTIEHLEPVLRFEKACLLLIKLGLIKLLTAPQDLLIGFGGINENRPFTVADDKLMDGFAALDLTLPGPQPTKEGFQVIVGPIALRPGITLKQTRPTLAEGRADMGDHMRVWRIALRVLLQLGQKFFDLALDLLAGRVRLPRDFWWVEAPLQFHKEAPLAFKLSVA
ncbi:MAG: hypothetical protein LC775_16225 [Acidobacteria bacterium]|nr:hypothetical protein [Acidobacteriota bacterium]